MENGADADVAEIRTVLVVDDEPAVLEVTGEMLDALGFSVVSCDSGQKAVELFERQYPQIDLAIIDLTMPDMGGGETFERLRQIDPTLKVILSSGYGREGQANDLVWRGCNGFIQKPYNLRDLSGKINEVRSSFVDKFQKQ